MQKKVAILTTIFVFCAVVALAGIVSAQVAAPIENVIHATGSGTVTGTPDRVQISFSVETDNPDVRKAQTDNAARMTQVISALVTSGISRDSMKTTGYSIYPVYADNSGGLLNQKVQTYRVTNTLQVTLNDVARSGDVIDTAVTNGINQVSSIQFMLSDSQAQSLRSSALRNAVANARADADAVAGAMAINITGMKNVDISQGYTPIMYDNSFANGVASKAAVPTPIQPGDITVTATVTITYTYH